MSEITSVEYNLRRVDFNSSALSSRFTVIKSNDSKEHFWIKTVKKGFKAFKYLNELHTKLKIKDSESLMPRPIYGSDDLGIMITEIFEGRKLITISYLYSSVFSNEQSLRYLTKIYYNLGMALSSFQNSMLVDREGVNLSEIIEETKNELGFSNLFSVNEKKQIKSYLDFYDHNMSFKVPLTVNHNDITLRNILFNESDLKIVDWDAMLHTGFRNPGLCLNEFMALYINIMSLTKLSPLINSNKIKYLLSNLLKGYLINSSYLNFKNKKEIMEELVFLFGLRFYLGIDIDRPLEKIYNGFLSQRFIKKFKLFLISRSKWI